MKTLKITVEGKTYEVTIEFLDGEEVLLNRPSTLPSYHVPAATYMAPLASPPPATAPQSSALSSNAPAGEDAVVSPLSGKIVSIEVQVGSTVRAGDHVLTMEAMKMNTLIHAPKAGKVAKILVSPGDVAEEGQTLMVIE